MDMKLRQYEQGKRFCDARRRARAASRRSTASGSCRRALPTLAELDDPAGWLARTEPAAA